MKKLFIAISVLVFFSVITQAQNTIQQNPLPDSLKNPLTDSTKVDSLKTPKKYDVDAVVYAASKDSLVFAVKSKKMFIYGTGELKYKETDLKSGKIFVNYETNDLEAFGIEDNSDTAKVKLKQTPVLKEGAEVYESSRLKYNFKTQRGFISMAKNREQDSRYEGERVKKVDKNTFFIEDGMYTTCASDTPHTYFTASEMKVIQKDKIIARWIFMHVGGVPIPIPLPFAVFPNEKGRRSGIIIPTYGDAGNRGQYFYNFGYFWAMNDYMDLSLNGDYYFKGGYGLRSRFRYAKRYNFNGNFEAGYSKIIIGEKDDPQRSESQQWRINWNHSQQIDPTMNLAANLSFMSSEYNRQNSINYNDILSQQVYSSASFSKRWDELGSININYSRTQDLSSGTVNESLPNMSFTKNISYPFKRDDAETVSDQKWYELIGYTYSSRFTNNRLKDSTGLKIRGGIQHDISVNASPKIGYFSVSPNFSYTEKWYNKRIEKNIETFERTNPQTKKVEEYDSLVTKDIKELNFVRTFNMSLSASTKLYGMMQPNLFGVEAFRHTLMPSVSYNYTPDFGGENWDYYGSYKDKDGRIIKYNKYEREVFGGPTGGESQSLSFSLGNIFEMKLAKDPNDTTKNSEANKIQLLNFNASVGYNFAADSMKLSSLNLNYRTQIGEYLNLDGSSSYTFYDYQNNSLVNKYLASEGKGLFRLSSFSFSISTNLSGEKFKSKEPVKKEEPEEEQVNGSKKSYTSLYDENKTPDLSIPWNLSLSYNYNLSKPTPSMKEVFSNLSADLGFSLTKNWKFTIRGSYDFNRKEISAPQITIFRDLHCWEMNLTWNPLGTYRGFRFEIRMKAPELQDIKVTKSSGLYSGRR